jgi:hypothetical protein
MPRFLYDAFVPAFNFSLLSFSQLRLLNLDVTELKINFSQNRSFLKN